MELELEKIKKLVEMQKEAFITARHTNENELQDLEERLEKLSPSAKARLGEIPNLDPKAVFSSLYENPINVEKYQMELNAINEFIGRLNALQEELINEAKELLQ